MILSSWNRPDGVALASRLAGLAGVGVVLAGLMAAAPASATSVTLALWHLDEAPGATTMVDSTGLGHDGNISSDVVLGVPGDPAVSADPSNTAYEFTGPNPIVRVPAALASDLNPGPAPVTLSAHLRVPAALSAGDYNVLQKGQATTSGGNYKLEIVAKKTTAPKFGYPACAFNSPGVKQRVYGPRRIDDGQWHTVQCVLSATDVYAQVDGVDGPKLARKVGSIDNTADVTLGGKPNNTHYFEGLADEVSISVG